MPDPYRQLIFYGGSHSLPPMYAAVKQAQYGRYVYSYSVWDYDPNLDVYAGL